jgi:hypothetical protein
VAGRLLLALLAGLAAFLRAVWRTVRQLFHEITGAFFLLFALLGALSVWREWQRGAAAWLIALAAAFTLMMASFALAAFRSARKLEKGK